LGDIVKGVLGGGWSLLVGWIVPSAINLIVLGSLVVPQLHEAGPAGWVREAEPEQQGIALLVGAAVLGLLLAGAQTPLYRLLEGYIGWHRWRSPVSAALSWSHQRQLRRKQVLRGRLDLIELVPLSRRGPLRQELQERLDRARGDRRLDQYAVADAQLTPTQVGLLREKARRYPVDDAQVVPTRLGNAIRRLEEYGYDRYRLDSQTLWYELYAAAPEQARKQVDQARTTVDFLICLLYGHLLVAVIGVVAAIAGSGGWLPLLTVAAVLAMLAHWWYRMAVAVTDDWAAAVRALVNLGRKPLAEGLGLPSPETLESERAMWATVSRLSARPYDSKSSSGDTYRRGSQNPADAKPDLADSVDG
jgi:hypothetical protein